MQVIRLPHVAGSPQACIKGSHSCSFQSRPLLCSMYDVIDKWCQQTPTTGQLLLWVAPEFRCPQVQAHTSNFLENVKLLVMNEFHPWKRSRVTPWHIYQTPTFEGYTNASWKKRTGRDGHFCCFHLLSVHDEEVDMFIRNVVVDRGPPQPQPPKNFLE